MIELLCVIAIIGILVALLLPAISRAYRRVKDMADEQEAPQIAQMLMHESQNYCATHPQYRFSDKTDFAEKVNFASKCRRWIESNSTEFVPFDYLTPSNSIVLSVHLGRRNAKTYQFSRGDLSLRPQD